MMIQNIEPIAIVGMSVRLPGAPSLPAYRKLLEANRSAIVPVPEQRWNGSTDQSWGRGSTVGGFLESLETFDGRSLGISPKEAMRMDPQQRLLLELAAESIDDAGRSRRALRGTATGVWVGAMWSDFLTEVFARPSLVDPYTVSGATLSFVANRVSFVFGLEGPSIVVDAACASSLVAIHEACNALRLKECDFALAGGVNILLSPQTMRAMDAAGVLSRAGVCRPLDDACDGFVRGEGGGLVLLKRYTEVEPWERVYAVIRGSAVNHNGHGPWVMAPNGEAQTKVIRSAMHRAGASEDGLDYVELHGTGFRLGDVVEVRALSAALGAAAPRCRVGSVKGNIGNLESAAGIASLIKVALSLSTRTLLPTPNLEVLNPGLEEIAPSVVPQRKVEPWSDVEYPVAGVTACSYSGTNAHVVLKAVDRLASPPSPALLIFSAGTPQGLASHIRVVREALEQGEFEGHSPANLAAALARRYPEGEYRAAVFGRSWTELRVALDLTLRKGDALAGLTYVQPPDTQIRSVAEHFFAHGHAPAEQFPGPIMSAPSLPWQRKRVWLDELGGSPNGRSIPNDGATQSGSSPTGSHDVEEELSWSRLLESTPADARLSELLQRLTAEVQRLMESPDDLIIAVDRPFFELGITSVALAAVRSTLGRELGIEVPLPRMYAHPTISALAHAALSLWAERIAPVSPSDVERELLRRLERLESR